MDRLILVLGTAILAVIFVLISNIAMMRENGRLRELGALAE